ncbi:MAG: CopG family transcriptional regulator [Acidobacteria bacterium]|nr:CopG family transcriptional regulator [Acidobacteriota bacterium]
MKSHFRRPAEAENRPVSNLIETAALNRLHEQQFVDDAEMAEVLANEKLVTRLRTGSGQARARQGRLIE